MIFICARRSTKDTVLTPSGCCWISFATGPRGWRDWASPVKTLVTMWSKAGFSAYGFCIVAFLTWVSFFGLDGLKRKAAGGPLDGGDIDGTMDEEALGSLSDDPPGGKNFGCPREKDEDGGPREDDEIDKRFPREKIDKSGPREYDDNGCGDVMEGDGKDGPVGGNDIDHTREGCCDDALEDDVTGCPGGGENDDQPSNPLKGNGVAGPLEGNNICCVDDALDDDDVGCMTIGR